VFHSIPALFISLALVGISDGFGNPLMTGYFTDLEEVEEYGYDRAFGVYSIFENIAQSVGSFVFSYVLILGVGKGLSFLAGVLIILSLIFMLLGIFDRRNRKVKQDVEEDISEA
jgi:MFS family permease